MGKTVRKQPQWLREDERWIKKGGAHKGPSRRTSKQKIMDYLDEEWEDGLSNYRR